MSAFREYEGWEEDLLEALRSLEVIRPLDGDTPQRRLLAAFGREKCGKVLHHASSTTTWSGTSIRRDFLPLTCNLPKGHHPYHPNGRGYCIYFAEDPDVRGSYSCGAPPEDPIHSPGHIADVPDEAWR